MDSMRWLEQTCTEIHDTHQQFPAWEALISLKSLLCTLSPYKETLCGWKMFCFYKKKVMFLFISIESLYRNGHKSRHVFRETPVCSLPLSNCCSLRGGLWETANRTVKKKKTQRTTHFLVNTQKFTLMTRTDTNVRRLAASLDTCWFFPTTGESSFCFCSPLIQHVVMFQIWLCALMYVW